MTSQPLPRGRRVAIVGNAHALGALTGDACLDRGLEVTHGPVSVRTQDSVPGSHASALLKSFR